MVLELAFRTDLTPIVLIYRSMAISPFSRSLFTLNGYSFGPVSSLSLSLTHTSYEFVESDTRCFQFVGLNLVRTFLLKSGNISFIATLIRLAMSINVTCGTYIMLFQNSGANFGKHLFSFSSSFSLNVLLLFSCRYVLIRAATLLGTCSNSLTYLISNNNN